MQEMFHGTPSKESKFALDEDVISSMPDNVITNILDRLPIQYAVRTGVLSQSWRFKWALLTQLVFDENFFEYLQLYDYYRNLNEPYKYNGRDIISRLLLHLKGPITKFVLYIPDNDRLMDVDIYHWVLFLSGKGIKDFTLFYEYKPTRRLFKLPTQLFSCTELKHLKLQSCCSRLPPSFSGFPNLLSLEFDCVTFDQRMYCRFLAGCPLLEFLKIMGEYLNELELNEIAKRVKLKVLYLNLRCVESLTSITKLSALPKLQELTLDLDNWMPLAEDGVEKFRTAFLCLKTLTLSNVHFGTDTVISFVIEMICSSPNLQTLEITVSEMHKHHIDILKNLISPNLQTLEITVSEMHKHHIDILKNLVSPNLQTLEITVSEMHKHHIDILKNLVSPNLQTLKITVDMNNDNVPPTEFFPHIHLMGQLQLQSVVFGSFKASESEVYLVEFLLARSPLLKKISIGFNSSSMVDRADGMFMFVNKLLKLYRASPVVKIELY